jgi:hypothetical protein
MKEHEWNEYEVFERLIAEKQYFELSTKELKLVNQFITNEQEYESFRMSGLTLKRWFRENPVVGVTDKTLYGLKQEFKRAHQPQVSFAWWKVTVGYAVAAIVFGFSGWWLGQSEKPMSITKTEQVLVRDTIFVATKPDTVVREKIIYRDRPVILTTTNPQNETPITKGVSMKEKEELDKLLVSGTE